MTVFAVTIIQGQYEERTEEVLIFSSLDKVWEWKNSYVTSADSFQQNGVEWAVIKEIEVDTNKVISMSDFFYLDVENNPTYYPLHED